MLLRSVASLFVAFATMASAGAIDAVHTPWNDLLAANVKGDRVDYAGVLKEKDKFEGYLKALADLDSNAVKSASKEERSALYINAYNAAVFQLIIKNPSKGSLAVMPPEVTGVKVVMIASESLAVADIARKKLFDGNQDPRFWSLLCDGSMSSAPILNQAVLSSNLDQLAEERTRLWLADTSRNKIDAKQTKVAQIPFDFFRVKPEFRNFPGGMQGFIKKYAPSGADVDKNRPTFFYNAAKNSVIAAAPAKGAKKGKKK